MAVVGVCVFEKMSIAWKSVCVSSLLAGPRSFDLGAALWAVVWCKDRVCMRPKDIGDDRANDLVLDDALASLHCTAVRSEIGVVD